MNYTFFDGHCDTPIELWRCGAHLRENALHVSLERAKRLGGYAQFFAFCTAWMENGMSHAEQYARALAYFKEQLRENGDSITLCRTIAEADAAQGAGKAAAFLAIEGAEAIDCDPGRLDEAHEQGVRMISLVWNIENALTGSCWTGGGLTAQGKEFFRRAQKLGMIVDVSHLSERGFWDMAELAEKPIVASHSNSKAVCAHARNLTDEQFRAICQLGGTAGLNLAGAFLTEEGTATFDAFRRHLDHFLTLGGEEHVAVGLDLDGTDDLPVGFAGVDHLRELADHLAQFGYSEKTMQSVFCDSLRKVVNLCTM